MLCLSEFNLNDILQHCGIHSSWLLDTLNVVVRLGVMVVVAWLTYWIARKWLAKLVVRLTGKTATNWDDLMFDSHFFNCFALFITPIVVQLLSAYLGWDHSAMVYKVINIWVVVAIVLLVSAVLDGINRIYDSYPVARNRPIKVFIQIGRAHV